MKKDKTKERTYQNYKKLVNMSQRDLTELGGFIKRFRKHMDVRPIEKNLRLLSKPHNEWNANDYSVANHIVNYITNMKKVKNGPSIDGCPSNRDVCLMMWGHDPRRRTK